MSKEKKYQTLNKTFARRVGKKLSASSQDILNNQLERFIYNHDKLSNTHYKQVFLEIGFGMGEHFASQVRNNPDSLYVGVEVFINGVAKLLKSLDSCQNFLIWPNDLDLILNDIPKKSLDGIYILFPDPWPKKKQSKKRLFNIQRCNVLKEKLKDNGFISFASDIDDYFESTKNIMNSDEDFIIKNTDFSVPHNGYIETKYHKKAKIEGREAKFITATL